MSFATYAHRARYCELQFWLPLRGARRFATARSSRGGVGAPAVPISNGQHSCIEMRRRRKSRDVEDLLLVERLPSHQSLSQRVEILAVGREQAIGLFMTLADNSEHFAIDDFRSLITERLVVAVARRAVQVGIFPRRELHQT